MYKKLIGVVIMLSFFLSGAFLFFIIRENLAAAKYELSDDARSYVTSCQEYMVTSLRERDDVTRHLSFMHRPGSLRMCSCVADRIASSHPNDVAKAQIILTRLAPHLDSAVGNNLSAAKALADEHGLSEGQFAELINATTASFEECI